ncbi:MAG: RDD family protein [Solirubrobacteraceae bacterium]
MRSIDLPPAAAPSSAPVLPPAPGPVYAGLITRGIAFVIDAAVILVVELVVWVSGVVIVGVLHLPKTINAILVILGGCIAILWSAGYFVAFWSTTGQTPGSRVMQIRVVGLNGDVLHPRRASASRAPRAAAPPP